MVPQELIDAYVQIVRNEPSTEAAAQHLVSFLEDAKNIAQAIQNAIDSARARATPAQ